MAKIINGTRVVTNEIRASYVHVAEPQSVNDGDKKYSMSIIIPKSDKETIDLINKAIDQAITDGITKFGGKRLMTMPAPPPAGLPSTEWWTSWVQRRRSWTQSAVPLIRGLSIPAAIARSPFPSLRSL